MGENVSRFDGILLEEDDIEAFLEDGFSSSEDEFVEMPVKDKLLYKH